MKSRKKFKPISVTGGEMIKAGKWAARYLKRTTFFESVFLSYLCGYFHTYPAQAREILVSMAANGFVTIDGDRVTWTAKDIP